MILCYDSTTSHTLPAIRKMRCRQALPGNSCDTPSSLWGSEGLVYSTAAPLGCPGHRLAFSPGAAPRGWPGPLATPLQVGRRRSPSEAGAASRPGCGPARPPSPRHPHPRPAHRAPGPRLRPACPPHAPRPRQRPARRQHQQQRLALRRRSPVLGPDAQQVTPSVRPRGPGRALGLLRAVDGARSPPVEAREGPAGRAHGRSPAALPRGRRCPPCHSPPPFIDAPHMPLSIVTLPGPPRAACPASSSCYRCQLESTF